MREQHINGRLIIRRSKLNPMRALGRLEGARLVAGAIAHEINNPLAIAVGFTEVLRESVPASEESTIDQITKAHDRITEVVADLQRLDRIAMTESPAGMVLDIKKSAARKDSKTNS